jgi:hypothetical protein
MGDPKLGKVIDALHDLEIPWLIFVDNDSDGAEAMKRVTDPKTGDSLTFDHDDVILSGIKQIEQVLIDAGYADEIEAIAADVGQSITGQDQCLKFLCSQKGWAPEAAARAAMEAAQTPPKEIQPLAAAIEAKLGIQQANANGS